MDTLAVARYAAMRWNTPLSESHADELLDHLDLAEATSIVDLGCGWGELLLRASARTGAKAVGVDTDPAGLDRGRRAALDRGLDVTFVEQPAQDWSGPPASGLTSTEIPATKEPGVSARRREDAGLRPANRRAERGHPTLSGTADRALCIGSSHTLGGSRAMLARLAEVVPRGRVLVGDACWAAPPTEAAHAIFGDDVLPLADLAAACGEVGWQVLHLSTADQHEWDDFESRHRAGQREWLLANPSDPRAAETKAYHDRREREYLTVYRGVLDFAYLVLAR